MFLDKIKVIKENLLVEQKKAKKDIFEIFSNKKFNIIAEIKKASPSLGDINPNGDIIKTAQDYISNGASAISVLTESEYFKGDINFLKEIREKCPDSILLRKDFIIDEFQLYEAKFFGADMVLLILSLTNPLKTYKLAKTAKEIGLEVLLEVHDESEMRLALDFDVNFIGVNNRNLKTLDVSLDVSRKLSKYITDDKIFVCESGIKTPENIEEMIKLGYGAFLVGTRFMKSTNPGLELKNLINGVKID